MCRTGELQRMGASLLFSTSLAKTLTEQGSMPEHEILYGGQNIVKHVVFHQGCGFQGSGGGAIGHEWERRGMVESTT